ncbi:unnamed protein product [Spodoptera exigua]|nr:unnamed protein product [Spodoptera exigua]
MRGDERLGRFLVRAWVTPLFFFQVSFSAINVFIRTLCYVEVLIQTGENEYKIVSWNIIILTIIWLLKDIVLVFLQNFFSEKFYMTVEKAETTCILLMKNKNCTQNEKRLYKKVLWEKRTFNKMAILGVSVGALLPISVVAHILFHTVDTFFRCLFYFTLVLQVLTMLDNVQTDRRVVILSVSLVLSVVWLSKDVMLVMIQSMQCEKFYITIEKAETACIQRLKNKHYLDCERNLCKDVVQLNRVSFSKMSACGLFYIDGTLPLQLMGILTNYIVVILQTMFL